MQDDIIIQEIMLAWQCARPLTSSQNGGQMPSYLFGAGLQRIPGPAQTSNLKNLWQDGHDALASISSNRISFA
jgi:predicted metal-binding protein